MLKKIITFILLLIGLLFTSYNICVAGVVEMPSNPTLESASIDNNGGDIINNTEAAGIKLMSAFKVIINGILVVYMVYIGATMIMSMGSNEEDISSSKRQIRFALVGLVFINIPGTIYNALNTDGKDAGGGSMSEVGFIDSRLSGIIVSSNFVPLLDSIIWFLEVIIFILAVFMFVMAGIWILTSRGREEKMKEGINKLIYGSLGLIFVGIIEVWKYVAFYRDVDTGYNLFGTLFQIAMFFVGTTVTFFLVLATYYYITSAGDEERAKKGKSIVINTFIAIVILLASYSFLVDLAGL